MSLSIYLIEICRLLTFFILLVAAYSKLYSFRQFRETLTESFNVKSQWSAALGFFIIVVEGVLAITIISNGALTYFAMLGAMLLFVVLTLVILVALIQDKLINCNCFGQSNEKITYFDVARNLIFILACGYYLLNDNNQKINLIIQLLLAGMAFSSFLIATNLNSIAMVNRDPKA